MYMPYSLREKAFILRHTRGTARKHILNHTFEMHRGDTPTIHTPRHQLYMMFVCGDIFDFPSDPTVFPKCDSIGPMNHTVLISYRSCCYKIILQLESALSAENNNCRIQYTEKKALIAVKKTRAAANLPLRLIPFPRPASGNRRRSP